MRYNRKEAMKYLEEKGIKMHLNTFYSHVKNGRIKATRTMLGGRFSFLQEDLDKFIEGIPAARK